MAGNAPIIKKIKKVSGHGHHGGAWKVAYADFVTAMMAFFLLMWLLNATTEEQRKGIADYFDNRIPLIQSSGGGDGVLSGESVTARDTKAESGQGAEDVEEEKRNTAEDAETIGSKDAEAAAEQAALEAIDAALKSMRGESDVADEMLSHVRTRLSPEGLVIELFDTSGAPLFDAGSAAPTPMLRGLLEMVATVAQVVTNDIALTGHTDASGVADANWRLSSDRAHSARAVLEGYGLPDDRVRSVVGKSSTQPMVEDPADPRNRRIEITLLRDNPTR